MTAYAEKLLDPRWQKRRLQIFDRDDWCCQICSNPELTLHVHHRWYEGEPWEAPDEALVTLCAECHANETESWDKEASNLIRELRRRQLNSSDVASLMCAFHTMAVTDHMDMVLDAVEAVLERPEVQQEVIRIRSEWRHQRAIARLAADPTA